MKIKAGFITASVLLVIIMASVFPGGCAYITGEAIDVPEPTKSTPIPRWVWSSSGDSIYSIVVDRYTHQPIRDVTPRDAFGIIGTSQHSENPVVIDVRTPQEYAGGYVRGAINIDYNSPAFRDEIEKFDKDKTYIVYCRTGGRSDSARNAMEELGFKHVINIDGGILEWQAAGLPVEH